MRRRLAPALGLLLIAAVACSSSTTSSPTTMAPAGSSTTAAVTGTTKPKIPVVTKPATVTKIEKTQLPAGAQSANFGTGVSADEQDCIYAIVYKTASDDPTIADNQAVLAGVTGASMVACVPQEKIAELLTADLAGKATEDQIACVKREITGADADSLSIFLGGLVLGDKAIVQSVASALDATCGTKLAST